MMILNEELLKAETHLKKVDPVIKYLIESLGPCTLKPNKEYFECLVGTIVSQQLSKKAADSIYSKLNLESGGITPINLFKLQKESFKRAGVSEKKIRYLIGLSSIFLNKNINFDNFDTLTDEEIIEILTTIDGIGRWSAEMFLIFSLNRFDVLPIGDVGFLRAFKSVYKIENKIDKDIVISKSEIWRPYRSIAVWYLWQSRGMWGKKILY